MEETLALSIPITFLVIVGLMTKWISDNRVRRELLKAEATPEQMEALMRRPVQDVDSSLKWGIVAVAIGVALVGIQLLNLDGDEPITFGLIFIFGGAGLLAFYGIKSRDPARF